MSSLAPAGDYGLATREGCSLSTHLDVRGIEDSDTDFVQLVNNDATP
jgi:hypothetical protein